MKHHLALKTVLMFFIPLIVTLLLSQGVGAFDLKSLKKTLFGTDASGGTLLKLDRRTGESTVVGFTGVGSNPSLAIDPVKGTMYLGGGGGMPLVYTVDKTTGAATLLGDSGLGFAAIGGMDFFRILHFRLLFASVNIAGDGGTGSDHLAIIDTATGAASIIGPYGSCTGVELPSNGGGSCTIEGMEAIAFDKIGRLWGAVSARGAAGTPGLYKINPKNRCGYFCGTDPGQIGESTFRWCGEP